VILFLLILLVGCLPGLLTPPTPKGVISGRIMVPGPETAKDITGWVPVANATVTLTDSEGITHTVTTDEDGYYTFTDITVNANTIITATATVDGNTVIIKDVIPQAVAADEDYDTGTADAESTALGLIVEELLEQGLDPEDINLEEIQDSDNFTEVAEQVSTILEENGNVTTDPDVTETVNNAAEEIINPPVYTPPEEPPEPSPEPEYVPTPPVTPNKPPTADAGLDRIIVTKDPTLEVTLEGSGTDTDGTVVSYSWDFGDDKTGTDATHDYAAPGTYPVTLTVTDDDGATASATMILKIFNTIQGAIVDEDTLAGDTIEVAAGTYTPLSTIIIDKNNLTLIGPQADIDPRPCSITTRTAGSASAEAIIDGSLISTKWIILIAADNVVINGFEVRFGLLDGMIFQEKYVPYTGAVVKYNIVHDSYQDEGIQLKACYGGLIEYNYVYNTRGDALNFANSQDCTIQFNEIYNADDRAPIKTWGGAIYTYDSTNINIIGNRIYDTRSHGIVLGGVGAYDDYILTSMNSGGRIEDNIIHGVDGDGLVLLSYDTIVEDNEIYGCKKGIQIIGANISVQNNDLYNNDVGISVKDIDTIYSTSISVHWNNIEGNTDGIINTATATVDATDNWWGDASGPFGEGPGTGDAVNTNVDYNPWYNTKALSTKTYYVGSGEDYITIQNAIGEASADDTINVAVGTYNECVDINKSLTLQGEDRDTTIIDGGGVQWGAINIKADYVTVRRFTIRNRGGTQNKGINIVEGHHCEISGNVIDADNEGIRVHTNRHSGYNLIENNIITGDWNGIQLEYTLDNTVTDNIITGSSGWAGINLGIGSNDNTIERNSISDCKYGISMVQSQGGVSGNIIKYNTITGCIRGIWWQRNPANTIEYNNILDNTEHNLYVLYYFTPEEPAPAENNWWGADPPDGTKFYGNIDFDPWSTSSN